MSERVAKLVRMNALNVSLLTTTLQHLSDT